MKTSQLNAQRLEAELGQLKEELANLTADGVTKSSRRRKKISNIPAEYEDTVRTLGKSFAVLMDPWIEPSVFKDLTSKNASKTDLDIEAEYLTFETYKGSASFRLYYHISHDQKLLDMACRMAGFANEVSRLL